MHCIKYEEPKDLLELSFYQKCVKAINVFSKLHDAGRNVPAQECIAALEHLKVISHFRQYLQHMLTCCRSLV